MDPEEILDLMRSRRSVRRFLPEAPPRELLERLWEAARWAPSNHNRQGFRFILFEDREEIRDLSRKVKGILEQKVQAAFRAAPGLGDELMHHATWFEDAPCLALVLHKRPVAFAKVLMAGLPGPDLISGEPLSAAMAVENALLAAHAFGLGACVLTAPLIAREAILEIPGLPAGFEPTCLLAIGYPAEEPPAPRRKEVEHIVEYRGSR